MIYYINTMDPLINKLTREYNDRLDKIIRDDVGEQVDVMIKIIEDINKELPQSTDTAFLVKLSEFARIKLYNYLQIIKDSEPDRQSFIRGNEYISRQYPGLVDERHRRRMAAHHSHGALWRSLKGSGDSVEYRKYKKYKQKYKFAKYKHT